MELRGPLSAVVFGATGLVGGRLLARLVDDPGFDRVATIGRRAPALQAGKLVHHVVDLDAEPDAEIYAADVAFSCLGTTIAKAGSDAAFRAVDLDLVVRTALATHAAGTPALIAVSALGADSSSKNFYLSLKGEAEDALVGIGFERLAILRPSLLLGPRDERRPAEALGQFASRLVNPLLAGPLKKYRSIDADVVAAAMIALAKDELPGVRFVESDEIAALGG